MDSPADNARGSIGRAPLPSIREDNDNDSENADIEIQINDGTSPGLRHDSTSSDGRRARADSYSADAIPHDVMEAISAAAGGGKSRATAVRNSSAVPDRRSRSQSVVDFLERPGRERAMSVAMRGSVHGRSGDGSASAAPYLLATTTVNMTESMSPNDPRVDLLLDTFSNRVMLGVHQRTLDGALLHLLDNLPQTQSLPLHADATVLKEAKEIFKGRHATRDSLIWRGAIIAMQRLSSLKAGQFIISVARLHERVNLGSPDESATRFVGFVLGPADDLAIQQQAMVVPSVDGEVDKKAGPARLEACTVTSVGSALASVMLEHDFHADLIECRQERHIRPAYEHFVGRLVENMVPADRRTSAQSLRSFRMGSMPSVGIFAVDSETAHAVQEEVEEEEITGVMAFLQPLKMPMKGAVNDFRRRMACFKDDWKSGMNQTSFLAAFFLFFATVAPTIAFGGLLQDFTNDQMGVIEMFLGQSLTGMFFAVFGGTPLFVLRPTGPVVAFIEEIWNIADSSIVGGQENFLPFYTWTCVWTGLLLILAGVFNLSAMMRWVTAFTEDIFSALVSAIFIITAVKKTKQYYLDPKEEVAVLSMVLVLGTHMLAMTLRNFKDGRFVSRNFRRFLADFNLAITIVVFTLFAYVFFPSVKLKGLELSGGFSPTMKGRSWWVDLSPLPSAAIGYALFPGVFLAMLFFLEQNIVAMLIQKPSHQLSKGAAFHWDLIIVGVSVILCGLLGLPVAHGSLPHSLMMLKALAIMEEGMQDGKVTREILRVHENRFAPFAMNALIFICIAGLPLLKVVPLPVVTGLFLFMGVSSAADNPLSERMLLLLTQPTLYPPNHVVRKLQAAVVHGYTLLQSLCLTVVIVIKFFAGVFFPLSIAVLIPLRQLILPKIFSSQTLHDLDGHM